MNWQLCMCSKHIKGILFCIRFAKISYEILNEITNLEVRWYIHIQRQK